MDDDEKWAPWAAWGDEAPLAVLQAFDEIADTGISGDDATRAVFERHLPAGSPERAWAMEHMQEWLSRAPWHSPNWPPKDAE